MFSYALIMFQLEIQNITPNNRT